MRVAVAALLLLCLQEVASFTPNFYHHHDAQNRRCDTKSIFFNAAADTTVSLQYSLTADDWHTASQLHPLDNLGVNDNEFIPVGDGGGSASGRAVSGSHLRHHSTANVTGKKTGGIIKEIMEAFFPVMILILLEIYSQLMLQFPFA